MVKPGQLLLPLFLAIGCLLFYSCDRQELDLKPEVETGEVSDITISGAILGGYIVDIGGGVEEHGHYWTSTGSISLDSDKTELGEANIPAQFSSEIVGLEVNKEYTYCAYALVGDEIVYGEKKTFRTAKGLADPTTLDVTDITEATAVFSGEILSGNGAEVLSRGACWSSSTWPSLATSFVNAGSGTGPFTASLTGLELGTLYFVRAFATTQYGNSYGDVIRFTTLDGLPDVITDSIYSIGAESAICDAIIVSDDGYEINSRGVVWSTVPDPTIEINDGIAYEGNNIVGAFSLEFTGLSNYTEYYVRAFASNSKGIGYGDPIIFKTKLLTGSIVDARDSHQYSWVKLGDQVWMRENLAFLPRVNDPLLVAHGTYFVYGYYGTDISEAKAQGTYDRYGVLYSWEEANTMCPEGWHLPSDDEWKELESFIGMPEGAISGTGFRGTNEGGKLKASGITLWNSPNHEASNEFLFNAGGGGYVIPGYDFESGRDIGRFWTSTIVSGDRAWIRGLGYNDSQINRITDSLNVAYSVRCIKDQ